MVLKDVVFTVLYIYYILYVYFHRNLGNAQLAHSVYGKCPPYRRWPRSALPGPHLAKQLFTVPDTSPLPGHSVLP